MQSKRFLWHDVQVFFFFLNGFFSQINNLIFLDDDQRTCYSSTSSPLPPKMGLLFWTKQGSFHHIFIPISHLYLSASCFLLLSLSFSFFLFFSHLPLRHTFENDQPGTDNRHSTAPSDTLPLLALPSFPLPPPLLLPLPLVEFLMRGCGGREKREEKCIEIVL